MRAAVLERHGDLDAIAIHDNYPDPAPGEHQVLVKVAATAVNFHDIFSRRGMPGIKIPLPLITGSDIAGEIIQVGAQVNGWRPGQRVLIDPLLRESGMPGMTGEAVDGGRAELVVVEGYQLLEVPEGVALLDAASLPLAYGTAYRMMHTIGGIRAGETVLVLGASGGVGVACVQLAKLVGATVIACASSAEKLAQLQKIGADHGIDYARTDFREALWELFGKPRVNGEGGVDVVVNFTGGDTWMPSLRCLKKGGRALTCGATAGYDANTDLRFVWTFEQRLLGSNGWQRSDLSALLSLLQDGSLKPVISKVLPLEQAAEAERLMESRQLFGKVLLAP